MTNHENKNHGKNTDVHTGHQSDHHANLEHKKPNHWIGTAIFLALILFALLKISQNSEAFMAFCNNFMRLTNDDVNMIPVGVVLYFSFWLIADKFLMQPHIALVEKREQLTSGSEQGAKEILKSIAIKEEQYAATIASARAEASSGNKQKIDEVRKQISEELSLLNKEVDQQVAGELEKLQGSQSEIRSRLFANASSLIDELVSKIQTAGIRN